MRKKLIALIHHCTSCEECRDEDIADHLIANGMVRRDWIAVADKLPDPQEHDWVLAQITLIPECIYGVPVVAEFRNGTWYDEYDNAIEGGFKVTHWMPLPEYPKEETK